MSLFELRVYTIAPGRAETLLRRFREHTLDLLDAHGMASLGYWVPVDRDDQLIYLIRHEGDPRANWEAFRVDPRWVAARAASIADGELTLEISSTLLREHELHALSQQRA